MKTYFFVLLPFDPSGAIKRLSVAAAIDGTYETVEGSNGKRTKKYVPRTSEELDEFEKIIKRAMGYNAEREDQVYVSSFSLTGSQDQVFEVPGFDWKSVLRQYSRSIINIFLIAIVFMFVVRPLLKSIKGINVYSEKTIKELPMGEKGESIVTASLPEPPEDVGMRENTIRIARENPERTEQLVRGWLHGEQ